MRIRCTCGLYMKLVNSDPVSNVSGALWEYQCRRCGAKAYLYSQFGDFEMVASGVLQTPDGREYRFDTYDWRWVAEAPAQAQ